MTTYHFAHIAVWTIGGVVRPASNARVYVTDPVTEAAVNVTQDITAPYADADATGNVTFTAESWPVRLRTTPGAGAFEDVYPVEAPQVMRDAVIAAQAAQVAAEDAAASATAPTDTTVSGLVGTASLTQTALDGRYVRNTDVLDIAHGGTGQDTAPEALVALGGAPLSLTGTYAARPAANTVAAGTIYYATNVPEQYRSNGTVWTVVGSGGNELGYAQIAADTAALGTGPTDIPGLTVTFVAGERPVAVSYSLKVQASASGVYSTGRIMLGASQIAERHEYSDFAGHQVYINYPGARIGSPTLTAGASYTVKVALLVTTGTGTVLASATNPGWLRVVTI